MARRILRLWKHPKSGIFYFRQAVPENLRPTVGRREIKFSLRTKDPGGGAQLPGCSGPGKRDPPACGGGRLQLTHKQVVALAGKWYRRGLMRREDERGRAEDLQAGAWALEHLSGRSLTSAYRRYEYQRSQGIQSEEPLASTDVVEFRGRARRRDRQRVWRRRAPAVTRRPSWNRV